MQPLRKPPTEVTITRVKMNLHNYIVLVKNAIWANIIILYTEFLGNTVNV